MKWAYAPLVAGGIVSFGSAASAQTNAVNAQYIPGASELPLFQTVQFQRPGDRWFDRDGFRDRRYWDRRRGGRGNYNRYYRDRDRDDGAAVAAGFLGFVLGAAIAGSQNDRTYAQSRLGERDWVTECTRRYRSFDPQSGTYLGYDGYRRYCQL